MCRSHQGRVSHSWLGQCPTGTIKTSTFLHRVSPTVTSAPRRPAFYHLPRPVGPVEYYTTPFLVGLTKADHMTTQRPHCLEHRTMIISTAERIIKTAYTDRTDSAIMLYAVNCPYMRNASPKNRSTFNEI